MGVTPRRTSGFSREQPLAHAVQSLVVMRPKPLMLVVLAAAAVACGDASSDASGTDEGATVIDPHGTDSPGRVQVLLPAGPVTASVQLGSATKNVGEIFDALSVGPHSVTLGNSGDYTLSSSTGVGVSAGQLTTVQGGLLAVDAVSGPRTLGLAHDVSPWGIRGTVAGASAIGSMKPTVDGSKAAGLFPGKYEINFGLDAADGVPVEVVANGSKKVVLTDMGSRRVARIQAPKREMPSASCSGDAVDQVTVNVTGTPSSMTMSLAAEQAVDVGTSPAHDAVTYAFSESTWDRGIPLPLGARGQGPAVFALARLDVDDVLVNATLPRVRGTYRVFKANPDGSRGAELLRCAPPTKTGVDVPPGKYRVEVMYATTEAGQKTDVHVLDVP